MNRYEIIFTLEPAWPFGLPQEGMTVIPSGTTWDGPWVDTWSGVVASHGTLSQYRATPVEGVVEVAAAEFRLRDNFLFVTLAAQTPTDAVSLAKRHAARFCMTLTMKSGTYFRAAVRGGSNRDTQSGLQPNPRLALGLVGFYDLSRMRDAVTKLRGVLRAEDAKLDRALAYFYHGAFLSRSLDRIEDELSFHAYYTLTEVILNFYKAMSVIVGDPSCGDKHQSVYKTRGVPDELWARTERVRRSRNDKDVAHYRAIPEQFENVRAAACEARKVAAEVIEAYASWLSKDATSAVGT